MLAVKVSRLTHPFCSQILRSRGTILVYFELLYWRRLESLLDCKEIKPVNPKVNQSCIFMLRTDAESAAPILWLPDAKNWLIGKYPDAGKKDWRWDEKGMTEDEMVGWQHQLNGHGFGWTPGAGDGRGGLACCSSWGRKESDTTERLNWTEHTTQHHFCFFTKRSN